MMKRPSFGYDTLLSKRHSRLVIISPSKSDAAEIHIELHQFPIDTPPQYQALSYTWCGQSPSRPVICNGKILLITENAFSAIRRLRHHSEPCKLWIDAICINQALTSEKTVQIAVMAEIYSKAHSVIIWLGEDRQLAPALRYCRILNTIDKMNFDKSKRTRRWWFDQLIFKAIPAGWSLGSQAQPLHRLSSR
jgi:hypothetical protein